MLRKTSLNLMTTFGPVLGVILVIFIFILLVLIISPLVVLGGGIVGWWIGLFFEKPVMFVLESLFGPTVKVISMWDLGILLGFIALFTRASKYTMNKK